MKKENKKIEVEETSEAVNRVMISLAPGVSVSLTSNEFGVMPYLVSEAERLSSGISRRGWTELDNIYSPKKRKNNEVV